MITVRHRAIHDGQNYTVWQSRESGQSARFAATFDRNRESIKPSTFPHSTMFKAVDAMIGEPMTEPTFAPAGVKQAARLDNQLQLWD